MKLVCWSLESEYTDLYELYLLYTYEYVRIRTYTYVYKRVRILHVYVRIRTYNRGVDAGRKFTYKKGLIRICTYISTPSVYVRISPVYTRSQNYVNAIYVRKWHEFEKAVYILPNGG